ncbi:hypothetical protein EJ08DRAFT_653196 [Tothia fuscella]|uniref:Uncharacterized protein n=1 Tax=Tothia fuscella TaxID=1048955 RepID=A0A9P4NIC1_9PEZI|nr:hypothetical protein EJ08DRAFT_653196 [Tothia fuscella]
MAPFPYFNSCTSQSRLNFLDSLSQNALLAMQKLSMRPSPKVLLWKQSSFPVLRDEQYDTELFARS